MITGVRRDSTSISPSAKQLLLLKSRTTLPYARRAAELLFGEEIIDRAPEESVEEARVSSLRRAHFEARARSVDEALRVEGSTRILELAAGFSFRGLASTSRDDLVYVDTDLPAIVALKLDLVARLRDTAPVGVLRVEPLDALDDVAFRRTAATIPHGPLAIVHEGLLMYLDADEKARLAATVREILRERGGAWISADVYVRTATRLSIDEATEKFLREHRVEENKFADWAEAERFFESSGFTVARRLATMADGPRQTWTLHVRE